MERENILLSFKGVVTSDLLTSVLSIMESKMDYMDESPKTKKKVFNVLERRLVAINGMDKDELKLYYQEVLNNGNVSDKGTAGLGMIDIARKSGNKLEYQFLPVNDTSSFFCLNIKID
jgi:transposase-like protein